MKDRYPVSTLLIFFSLFILLLGCNRQDSSNIITPLGPDHYFDIAIEDKLIRLQLAVEAEELRRGLMYRKNMSENEGMIFLYTKPQRMSFWMRNTSFPLDVGFISSDGVLQEFYPLYPYDETTVVSRSDELQYALELNQGWFQKNNINRGAKLDLEMFKKAIQLRGYEPSKFNLP
tara:strand:+ start:287 stop:811 length:525 start_codon:yes stop_codon:yes gene_type:complete